ncbi:hypothetical protein [Nonomuraea sp. GTA35]|uniref:hypothetical protein n=1 Tax=Nonomuraea sp. GTA35 TaxID=1676746 RepID=UPI0035BF4C9D
MLTAPLTRPPRGHRPPDASTSTSPAAVRLYSTDRGAVAQVTSPAAAMTVLAAGSVAVTLTLAALGGREERLPGRLAVSPEPAATD